MLEWRSAPFFSHFVPLCHGFTGFHSLSVHPIQPLVHKGGAVWLLHLYIRGNTFPTISLTLFYLFLLWTALSVLKHTFIITPTYARVSDSKWHSWCHWYFYIRHAVGQGTVTTSFTATSQNFHQQLWQRGRWWWEICVFLLIVGVFFFPLPHIFWESLLY